MYKEFECSSSVAEVGDRLEVMGVYDGVWFEIYDGENSELVKLTFGQAKQLRRHLKEVIREGREMEKARQKAQQA